MNSSNWVDLPSHVQITISQARELLLKNKSASSELYVIVATEKEKFVTPSVSRSTQPQWNFTNEIPLMSLDTTLHITVREHKGRLSDKFIGYIAIPLSGFKLTSKQVTHWYKLGSKPGKNTLKLRGDLQVTLQLQFKFTDSFTREPTDSKKVYPVAGKGLLKRSKSEIRVRPLERVNSLLNEGLIDNTSGQPSLNLKEKMSVFRRSFRKKNRSPVLQNCEDEFASFAPPNHSRARSNTIDITSKMSKIPSGTSISDVSSSESESTSGSLKPSALALFAKAAALEVEEKQGTSGGEGDIKMSPPASKHNSLRIRKKRWTMMALPTASPAHTPTDHAHTPDSINEDTYVARSHNFANTPRSRTRSLCVEDTEESLVGGVAYGSVGEFNGSRHSPDTGRDNEKQEPDSGYSTSSLHKIKRSKISEEMNKAAKKDSQKSPTGNGAPIFKSDSPTNNRKTVISPPRQPSRRGSISPSIPSTRKPAVLNTSANVNLSKREPKWRTTSAGTPTRSPALSRTPSNPRVAGTRPLSRGTRSVSMREKAPVRRRPKSMVVESTNKAREVSELKEKRMKEKITSQENKDSKTQNKDFLDDAELDKKVEQVTEMSDCPSKEEKSSLPNAEETVKSDQLTSKESDHVPIEGVKIEQELSPVQKSVEKVTPVESPEPVVAVHESASGAAVNSDVPIRSATPPDQRKPRHTVAYSESSPLFKDGFKPVSLFPPSLMNYQSQTLPSRGKLARQATDSNFKPKPDRPSTLSSSQEDIILNRQNVTLRQHTNKHDNIVMHRRSMNIALLSSYNPDALSGIPQSPPREISSMEELARKQSTASTISQDSESRPSTPSLSRFGGKTPGEIVTSALRNRKPSGGLRQAINMYQESRKQKRENHRSLRVEEECLDRSTSSADNSPRVRRNRSAASAFSGVIRNPFSSVRRTKSLNRSSTIGDSDTIDGGSVADLGMQLPSLKVPANSLVSINSTENSETQSETSLLEEEHSAVLESRRNKSVTSPSNETREHTPTLTDTSSIKTLTGLECTNLPVRRTSSPNPAGAVTTSNHIRHTTCSSIGSEGIGSLASEELSLDELMQQDCSHWSKEELVKELIHSKQRLKNTEDELKDVKNYLDNLLLRIMETNPLLLNAVPRP